VVVRGPGGAPHPQEVVHFSVFTMDQFHLFIDIRSSSRRSCATWACPGALPLSRPRSRCRGSPRSTPAPCAPRTSRRSRPRRREGSRPRGGGSGSLRGAAAFRGVPCHPAAPVRARRRGGFEETISPSASPPGVRWPTRMNHTHPTGSAPHRQGRSLPAKEGARE
jgi:hypothetical protein